MSNDIVMSAYNKIARNFTSKYFEDKTDLARVDKFLTSLPKNANVLDCGCGAGNWTKYLMDKGFNVEGIDFSTEMIKIAKEKVPDGKFKLMDMRMLDYKDNVFDGILSLYSLIHISSADMPKTLKEFCRVLNKNGILMIVVQEGKSDRIVNEPLGPGIKTFINFFTVDRLITFLQNAGFIIYYKEEIPYKDEEFLSEEILFILAKKVEEG